MDEHIIRETSGNVNGADALKEAALAVASAGWPIFPCRWDGPKRKTPLTRHGHLDATADADAVRRWWDEWPRALIGTPTGERFVVLDVDPRHGGFQTLARLGFETPPATPTVITGGGGRHFYFFQVPTGVEIRNTEGAHGRGIGAGLDWRGVGGYVIVPAPGSGYSWVPETMVLPLAAIPAALMPREARDRRGEALGPAGSTDVLTDYGEAALRSAALKIINAPNGEQRSTMNAESYSIGRLAGAGGVPVKVALNVLVMAAKKIPTFDPRRPWKEAEIEATVRRAFADGWGKPRLIEDPADRWRRERRAMIEAAEAYDAGE